MRIPAVLLCAAACADAAGWEAVRALSPGLEVRLSTASGAVLRGTIVSVSADSIAVATGNGQEAVPAASVLVVKTADPSRRLRNGLIGSAAGLAVGGGIGFAVCPGCSGEGRRWKFLAPGLALGAALGAAAGFLPRPYRTVYRAPRK